MNESSMARIPVRPLPYADKDLAMTREIIIDYDKGNIFISDKDDPSILIDITKLIADSYLSNINGDNTNVTINGEVYNLAELLTELKRNKITILNSADSQAIPASVNYDHDSVSIEDNVVSLFGFKAAANNSKPMKKDGALVWLSPEDQGDPGEPKPGANINVIDIIPTNNSIVLYAKPFMNTTIVTSPITSFLMKLPKSQPKFARIKWKLDTAIALSLSFSSNMTWIDDDIMGTPVEKRITAASTYLIEMETWDFGETWIVISSLLFPIFTTSEADLPAGHTYLTDNDGALLAYEDNVLLVTGEEAGAAAAYHNGVVKQIPTLMPKTTESIANGSRGSYFIKKITDLQTVDSVDSSIDKLFLNKSGGGGSPSNS